MTLNCFEDGIRPRPGADAIVAATQAIETLERKNGGRLGVMALDTGTNATIEHRPSVQRQSWKSRRPAIFRLPIGRPLC